MAFGSARIVFGFCSWGFWQPPLVLLKFVFLFFLVFSRVFWFIAFVVFVFFGFPNVFLVFAPVAFQGGFTAKGMPSETPAFYKDFLARILHIISNPI